MCFDPTRHYLYALTAKGSESRNTKEDILKNTTIHVYSLTSNDGKGTIISRKVGWRCNWLCEVTNEMTFKKFGADQQAQTWQACVYIHVNM